jgi:hypothetical protein
MFRHFLGDVRRELVERPSVVLHGTLGLYLRDAWKEGCAYVACIHAPGPIRPVLPPPFWWFPLSSYLQTNCGCLPLCKLLTEINMRERP